MQVDYQRLCLRLNSTAAFKNVPKLPALHSSRVHMHFWIKGVYPRVVLQVEVHGKEAPWPGDGAHKKQPGLNYSGTIICVNACVMTRSTDSFLTEELSCTEPGSDNCWRGSSGELSVGSQGCEGVGRKIIAGHELKKPAGSTFEPHKTTDWGRSISLIAQRC